MVQAQPQDPHSDPPSYQIKLNHGRTGTEALLMPTPFPRTPSPNLTAAPPTPPTPAAMAPQSQVCYPKFP